jgi:hypothetical protein
VSAEWQHGSIANATCPHGFAPGSCLICQTLGASSPVAAGATKVEVLTGRSPRRPRSRLTLGTRVIGVAAIAVAAVLVVGWVAALIWAALRVVELIGAVVVSGWVGWRLGVRHGRRHPAP